MIRLYSIPNWVKKIFKEYIWHIDTNEKVIYLTFDDGPIPNVTEFVLNELAKFNAKATFFCVGDNISKHPQIFKKIIEEKHAFGNHTFNHLKGWQTNDDVYFANIQKFEDQVTAIEKSFLKLNNPLKLEHAKLFRPPYGRIRSSQAKVLRGKYQIIMWDVLTCDYDKSLSEENCLKNAIKHSKHGSIVVFHDSLKSQKNLFYVLPKYLKHFSDLGYRFEGLNSIG